MNQPSPPRTPPTTLLAGILLLFAVACSPTRYIPDGEYLLDKVTIRSDNKTADEAQLQAYIQQKPNASKLGPEIYNLVKNDSGFIKKIIRRIGEPPVLLNQHLVTLSVNELKIQLQNMGYLQATVSASIDTAQKKAEVNYHIHKGEPYLIRRYDIDLPQLQTLRQNAEAQPRRRTLRRDRPDSVARLDQRLIKENAIFDLNLLKKERERISSLLRNQGYYTFTEENLQYLADTTALNHQVDLTMTLADSARQARRYTVQRINIFSGYDPLAAEDYQVVDSVEYDGLHIYYDKLHFLRPSLIRDKTALQARSLYREHQGENTYNAFQTLNSTSRVDMQYRENNYPDSAWLDCDIYLTPGNNHALQTGLEGTNKAGDLGLALDIAYRNQNTFNGSEILNLHLRGAYELAGGLAADNNAVNHNYYELGIEPSITFPKLHLPLLQSLIPRRFNTQTQYAIGFNIQRRPEYIRNFFNLSWKTKWTSNRNTLQHNLNLLEINYIYIPWMSTAFLDYLAHEGNELTKMSYGNVFTAGLNYSLVYANAPRRNPYTLRFSAETSGNLLYLISKTTEAQPAETGQYLLLNNPYAQYAKTSFDLAKTLRIDHQSQFAFHLGIGLAIPYLNSMILPFEKRFYGGGPNHVRGWNTRKLGPGRFRPEEPGSILQDGDINLILSAEYRIKILPWLEPALFLDAGNIWTIHPYENQPGGHFRWRAFYREIALGAGLGLRFDFNILTLRLDAGAQIYDPASQRSIFLRERFFSHTALYLAIGYPF